MRKLLTIAAIIGVVTTTGTFAGEPVNVTIASWYETIPEGYRYYLTVYNNTDPQQYNYVKYFDIWLVPASDLVCPPDWSAYVFDPWYTVWSAGKHGEWWKGVPPGKALSGFAFTSPTLATEIKYNGGTSNPQLGSYVFFGRMTPILIPEPCSLLALGSGLAGALFSIRKRRGK